jgi:hypothetical protein
LVKSGPTAGREIRGFIGLFETLRPCPRLPCLKTAQGLGQLVNGEIVDEWRAVRELFKGPMEEAAVEAMLSARAQVLEALEAAGVEIKPPP